MNKNNPDAGVTVNRKQTDEARTRSELVKTRREQARTRTELAKTRQEQTRTRTELVKTRREQARTRTELVKTREEKTEIRTEQVEKTVQRAVHKEFDIHDLHQKISTVPLKEPAVHVFPGEKSTLERLTSRQREILELIAKSRNTKQIAETLKVSSKTVEYHRSKLMAALNVHDIPGLVRFALRVGLIQPES